MFRKIQNTAASNKKVIENADVNHRQPPI